MANSANHTGNGSKMSFNHAANADRTSQAWKEDQFDVAEHMFSKAEALSSSLSPSAAEKLADLLFRVGESSLHRKDFPMAIKWVQRAYDMLNDQELEKMSRDAVELRLTVAQVLVTALLGVQTTDGYEKAQNLVRYLKSEIGDKLVVLLLDLEVLIKAPDEVFDADAYARILERMMQIFNHQETNFKLLVYHIRKLHEKSPSDGVRILDMFLLTLNGQQCDASWIENLVITRMWMITSHRDSDSGIDEAQKLLHKLDKPLGAEGTVAAQTVWYSRHGLCQLTN